MRRMRNKRTGQTIKIREHIILSNWWEYYVIDGPKVDKDILFCLVMGFETEMGDVYEPEILPYIRSRSKELELLAPAEGWEWL